jgi:hypothetical protein
MPILLEVSSIGQKCVKEKKNLCTGSSSRFEIGFWEATLQQRSRDNMVV